ncbi:MAG: DUF6596 domain-containing protein [Pseudomonadota bacterium]
MSGGQIGVDRGATDPRSTWLSMGEAAKTAERVARDSYGRLLAYLASETRDLALAEDALSDAFAAALKTWPNTGAPKKPEAWLLTTARRRLIDQSRRSRVRDAATSDLGSLADEAASCADAGGIPDRRLELMFACTHPAIDVDVRTPLILQTVLGVDAGRIASMYLVSPGAMSQRLVRAKTKIRDAGIPFRQPDPEDWPSRTTTLLDAVYAAYGLGWDDAESGDDPIVGFSSEAEWLARLLVSLAPEDAEALGLLSLILFCESRRPARRDSIGQFVPLGEQDTTLWRKDLIEEAKTLLFASAQTGRPGRFQIEAALQAKHAERMATGQTDWRAIASLYRALLAIAPSLGAMVAHAAALGEAISPDVGLRALDDLPEKRMSAYQPYWAARGHLLLQTGRRDEARLALEKAAAMSLDRAVADYLREKAAKLI